MNLRRARTDITAAIDPSFDIVELQTWAMSFLERWSVSSALAARYLVLLGQFPECHDASARPYTEGSRNAPTDERDVLSLQSESLHPGNELFWPIDTTNFLDVDNWSLGYNF